MKTTAEAILEHITDDEVQACAEEIMAENPAAQREARSWIPAQVWNVISVASLGGDLMRHGLKFIQWEAECS